MAGKPLVCGPVLNLLLLNMKKTPSNWPFGIALALALAPSTFNMNASDMSLPALKLVSSQRPLVIGHRGYCQFAPENTLPSFKLAVAAGADLVELDYYHTKDGKLIVIHDGELDRTTDATNRWGERHIKIGTKTVAEIQSLDAGSWFDPKYAGTKVPLLAEALDTIEKGSVTLIERKGGDPAACISLLRGKDLINKVVVQSFDWQYLRAFHEQQPDQVLGALGPASLLADGKKPCRASQGPQCQVAGRAGEDRRQGSSVERQSIEGSRAARAPAGLEGVGLYCQR